MDAARPRQVALQGADESLRSLLSDVLGDMGFVLCPSGQGGGRPDVVLALVRRGDSILRVLQRARDEVASGPVMVLLPFDDERLRRLALNLGARGCYAMGTPLEELRRLLRDAVEEPPRAWERLGLSDAPGMGASGRHDD